MTEFWDHDGIHPNKNHKIRPNDLHKNAVNVKRLCNIVNSKKQRNIYVVGQPSLVETEPTSLNSTIIIDQILHPHTSNAGPTPLRRNQRQCCLTLQDNERLQQLVDLTSTIDNNGDRWFQDLATEDKTTLRYFNATPTSLCSLTISIS